MPPKAFVSWSSGKDSAYALHEAQRLGLAEIAGVLTTINQAFDRVAMHGVRDSLLDRQVAALGLPARKVLIPSPCPNEIYEARMAQACADLRAQGVTHIVFGDLFLEDIRKYREEKLAAVGMTAHNSVRCVQPAVPPSKRLASRRKLLNRLSPMRAR